MHTGFWKSGWQKSIPWFWMILFQTQATNAQHFFPSDQTILCLSPNKTLGAGRVAGLLQYHLLKAQGKSKGYIFRYSGPKTGDQYTISIGPFSKTDSLANTSLENFGFTVRKDGNALQLHANTSTGLLLAGIYFLDHFCGIRMYHDDTLFYALPSGTQAWNWPEHFETRQIPFCRDVLATGFSSFNWVQSVGLMRKNFGSLQHTLAERLGKKDFQTRYPQIFPLLNGKRSFPASAKDQEWVPDLLEPTLEDAALESAMDYFRANPTVDGISFSIMDSYFPKAGPMFDSLQKTPGADPFRFYTNLYLSWLNRLAVKMEAALALAGLPPKKLIYTAYNYVNECPEMPLHPTIVPVLVFRAAESDVKSVFLDSLKNNSRFSLHRWAQKTKQIGHHDWAQGEGFLVPRYYPRQYQKLLREMEREKLSLQYAHIEAYPHFGLDGPKLYFISKLLWDPNLDLDSLLNLYCTDLFGPAAEAMASYFSTLEKLTRQTSNDAQHLQKRFQVYNQLWMDKSSRKLVQQARHFLDQALVKSKGKGRAGERVRYFDAAFSVYQSLVDIRNMEGDSKQEEKRFPGLARKASRVPKLFHFSGDSTKAYETLMAAFYTVRKKL